MKNTFTTLGILIGIVILLGSCYSKKADKLYPSGGVGGGCDTTNVTFSKTIQPILLQTCALSGCHDASAQSGGYLLNSYSGAREAGQDGDLIKSLTPNSGVPQMPQTGSPLTSCDIKKITIWVNTGMPE